MMLQAEEIDHSGNVVPGSVILVIQPVAGQPVPAAQTMFPMLTPPFVILLSLKKSDCFTTTAGILAFCALFIVGKRDG
jgi:hypothetical protein